MESVGPRRADRGAAISTWNRWGVLLGGVFLVACSESFQPPPQYLQVPVRLAFTAQPGNATAGAAFNPVMTVAIQDSFGKTVTAATNVVTLTLDQNPAGGTLVGTTSVAAVAGIASFQDLRIEQAGAGYTLKAAATGLIGAKSTSFTIAAGPATRLAFVAQPSTTMSGGVITPPVQVAAEDSFTNVATGFQGRMTVALGDIPSGTLAGTTEVSAVGGVATFNDLSIAELGPAYTLTASAPGYAVVASAPFAIIKPTGLLQVTVTTTGASPDPDGYAVCIDSTSDSSGGTSCAYGPLAISVNAMESVTVDTGAHTVLLVGVAPNCAVTGDNPVTVSASWGVTSSASFAVVCTQLALHVTTATSGASLDPDGYALCVDPDPDYGCSYSPAIGVNDTATVSLTSGTHQVELDGVSANCTVAGDNPRAVVADTVVHVAFVITCVAAGTVRVATVTTGVDLASGYVICIDASGASCSGVWLSANGLALVPGVTAGSHTVSLPDVPENCTIAGGSTRAVTVPQDDTVDVTFDVGCVTAERIAYTYGGWMTLARVDGLDAHDIAPGSAPAWSPDGARLAYECGADICAINADGTGLAQLTRDGANNRHPTWSPDGSRIAFSATHATSVPSVFETDLYAMAADGSGVVQLTQDTGFMFLGSPAWSPDGTKIAFDCQVDTGNDDICSVNADGTGFARLTNDPARDYGAAWKPDGSALAFATTRYGTDEIVLMSPAGGGVTRIGAGLPGFGPTWSPDGSRLALVQTGTYEDEYGYSHTYDFIVVAQADGSASRYLTEGSQPAWKPHP